MREQEMRMRVFRFLRSRMRNMLMPATVGIGLTVGGCTSSTPVYSAPLLDSSSPVHDTSSQPSPDVVADSSAPRTEVLAPADLRPGGDDVGVGRDVPIYGVDMRPPNLGDASADASDAPTPTDQAVVLEGGAIDTNRDLGVITKYGVPIPDAAPDSARDLSGGGEIGLPIRYAAVMPPDGGDAAVAVPLYMAQLPQQS